MRGKRIAGWLVASGCLVLGFAAPAFAEGSFKTSMTNAGVGHDSRSWQDNNVDGTSGSVTFLQCRESNVSTAGFRIGVYKEDLGPDTQVGLKWIGCCPTTQYQSQCRVTFGDVGKDQYHFTVKDDEVPGQKYTVSNIKVVY